MKSLKTTLGILFYKNRIAVSQCCQKVHAQQPKTAEFILPADQADLHDMTGQAERFKLFLKENGFHAKKAVIGLDAGRVFTTTLNLQAARDEALNDEIIRIQLERKTQLDMNETAFGYMASGDKIFVVAVLKKQIDQIRAFLLVAGIRSVCITASSMVIGLPSVDHSGCCILEYPESAELLFSQNGQVTDLRDITNGTGMSEFLPRIHRQIQRLTLIQNSRSLSNCRFFFSRASASESKGAVKELFGDADVRIMPAAASSELPAVYAHLLAERAIEGKLGKMNLLASMQPHKKSMGSSRWMPRAIIAAALVMVLVLLFALEWHLDNRKIEQYTQQLKAKDEEVKIAEQMIDRTAYARQWFVRQTMFLDMLMELTKRFPEQKGIWLNSLAVDQSLNQIITGKASGEQAILDAVDNLKSSPAFQNVKILYIRQAGQNTREETFAISFRYNQEK